jgi:phosphate transport system substrate-binding protein
LPAPESAASLTVAAEAPQQPALETAPTITLTTNVGAIEIVGKLLEFTGTEYVVFTPTGEYRLQAATVTCSGEGCPGATTVESVAVAEAEQPTEPELGDFTPLSADLRIAGADAVGLGLLPSLWKGYADWRGVKHDLVQLSDTENVGRFVDESGQPALTHYAAATEPSAPFAALIDRSAEFSLAARPPTADEAAALLAAGAGDMNDPRNFSVIAVESIALIVHPDNPVSELSIEQIAGIYSGAISNWAEVGGPDAPISVLGRNDDSGTRAIFDEVVLGATGVKQGAQVAYPEGGNAGMLEAVLNAPIAIGYVAFDSTGEAKRLNLASACGITSMATPFSVKTEEYPLVRRHYLYSRTDGLTPEAREFFGYVQSDASQSAIAASDLVNFAIEVEPADVARSRGEAIEATQYRGAERRMARDMLEELRSWERLSATFRFDFGSSRLGTKELADIKRLVRYLDQQPEGIEVAIVGFADSLGDFDANQRLSLDRASLVAAAIDAERGEGLQGVLVTTKAYGEIAPAACNTAEDGRRVNRRVEIWIRRPG